MKIKERLVLDKVRNYTLPEINAEKFNKLKHNNKEKIDSKNKPQNLTDCMLLSCHLRVSE